MQANYSDWFARDMGCTEAQWLGWLPPAIGDHPWTLQPQAARVSLGDGLLSLTWQVAPPRVIGQIRMPVLQVNFRFTGVDALQRHTFMKRFDLYLQRGGG